MTGCAPRAIGSTHWWRASRSARVSDRPTSRLRSPWRRSRDIDVEQWSLRNDSRRSGYCVRNSVRSRGNTGVRKSPGMPIRNALRAQPRRRQIDDLVVDAEHAPRIIDDEIAGRGEAHARRALVEQFAIEQHLQALDLRADRRLRHTERIRGLCKRAQIDNCDQRSQQFSRNIDHSPSLEVGFYRRWAYEARVAALVAPLVILLPDVVYCLSKVELQSPGNALRA